MLTTKVIVADDRREIRYALRVLLEGEQATYEVMEAADLRQLMSQVQRPCADLVLLDQDLLTIAPETLDQVTVRATVAGGRVVYSAAP